MQDFQRLGPDRTAGDFFQNGKRDVAAVEDREWHHVEHREVDVEEHHEGEDAPPAVFHLQELILQLGDADRPTEVADADAGIRRGDTGNGRPHHPQAVTDLFKRPRMDDPLVLHRP